jgi:hypothetical protein
MNIFFLDFDPQTAARFHCDKHVVKMILETAQLLYCAHWMIDASVLLPTAYRKTHPNHPCAVWTRESLANYNWLADLGLALCEEFVFRYGHAHKTHAHIAWLAVHPPAIPNLGITEIRQAMPDIYKRPNPIEAYRTFYRENKMQLRKIVGYSKRASPVFLLTALA